MKKFTLIALLFYLTKINAQTWVTIPDANFVSYLQTVVPSAMNGNQMNITSAAVTTTQTLVPSHYAITDLTGIQYFTSLKYLACYNNGINYMPALPNSLTYLNCNENNLTSVPTLPNSLIHLDCSYNFLTNLPTLPNSLVWLDCSVNKLNSIPNLGSNLTNLYCSNNYITSLPALPNSLTLLYCNQDSLTSLPTLDTSLVYLQCYTNKITCFPAFPNSITSLNIGANPYNCLPNYITAMDSVTHTIPLCTAGNSNGCTIAGIPTYNTHSSIKIYPNPAQNKITIDAVDVIDIKLFDVLGEQLTSAKQNQLDVSSFNDGVYFIQVQTKQNSYTQKIIVQH
jgi:Leucine-rich repeat (LRR) protein